MCTAPNERDAGCHLRSLAESLVAVAGDPLRAKRVVAGLMTQQGVPDGPSVEASALAEQAGRVPERVWRLEDLLLRFVHEGMTPAHWQSASRAHPELFPRPTRTVGWYEHVMATYDGHPPWHELPVCLAYVALLCDDFVGSATLGRDAHLGDEDAREAWEDLSAALAGGASVLLGTDLGPSGHVVLLLDVLADGVVIEDPCGLVGDERLRGDLERGAFCDETAIRAAGIGRWYVVVSAAQEQAGAQPSEVTG